MNIARSIPSLLLILVLAGCAAFTIGTQVQSGRRALLVNDPERALPYFLEAAQSDPNFIYRSVDFHEGIWTYVGRTQYATKRYADARQSLERALSLDSTDLLARLYFGLALARSGDNARGVKEILDGMKGIYDFIDYMNRTRPIQAFWDPLGEIRKAIEVYLLRAPGSDLVLSESLIADAEWLGNKMEDEVERVRQDEQRWHQREFNRSRDGGAFGFGIGF